MPVDSNVIFNIQNQRMQQKQGDRASIASLLGLMQQDEALAAKNSEFDLEKLAQQALMKQEAGLPLDATDNAALKAYDGLRTSKRAQNPLSGEMYSPYASILGVPQGTPAPAPQPTNAVADIMGVSTSPQASASAPNTPMANAPIVQITKEKEFAKADAKAKAARDNVNIEKTTAAPVFDRSIERMQEINDELKDLNAIPSEDQSLGNRAFAQAKSSYVGQKLSTSADPKAQALREEYRKLKNSILPAYKKAAGLTAGEGNTETEQENIKSGFGDESGFYEANKRLLDEMSAKYGSQKKKAPGDKPKSGGVKFFNPKTGKIEVR